MPAEENSLQQTFIWMVDRNSEGSEGKKGPKKKKKNMEQEKEPGERNAQSHEWEAEAGCIRPNLAKNQSPTSLRHTCCLLVDSIEERGRLE